MKNLQITALIDKAQKRDTAALETLYNTYYKDVFYVCKKLSLNDEDAKDITQDTFITAFSNLSAIKDKTKFKQWICGIANYKALNLLRHSKVLDVDSIEANDNISEIPEKNKSTEDMIIDNETAEILKNVIDKLPLDQRIAVFMFYYQDMTVKEIAQAYNCSENTIRSRLNYAKKTITKEINNLENNGVKIRCISALPFLYLLFYMEWKAFACQTPSSSLVIANTLKSLVSKTDTSTASATLTSASSFTLKKVLALILCSILVIGTGIFAIIKFSDSNDSNIKTDSEKHTEHTEHTDDRTDKEAVYWYYKDIELPKLVEAESVEVTYPNGEKTLVSNTPFNYTLEELKTNLEEIPYFHENNLHVETTKIESCNTDYYIQENNIDYLDYDVEDQLYVKDEDVFFGYVITSSISRDVSYYNNYNRMVISFSEFESGENNQAFVKDSLSKFCGEELANYLTYCENLTSIITVNKTDYNISRKIKIEDDADVPSVSVQFTIYIVNNELPTHLPYTGNYDSIYDEIMDECGYSMDDFIKGDFGSTDIFNHKDFGSKFMQYTIDEVYEFTSNQETGDTYTIKQRKKPDGTFTYTLSMHVCEYIGISKFISPELDIEITLEKKDDTLLDYSIEFSGDTGTGIFEGEEESINYSRIYPSLVGRLKALLGDVDLSKFTYENILDEDGTPRAGDSLEYTDTYLGKEANVSIEYELKSYPNFGSGSSYNASFTVKIEARSKKD